MGLLDKAGNVGTAPEKKPKAAAKAIPKATVKDVPKAVSKAPVAKSISKKPVKAKKAKTPRTTGLPDGFELASKMNRSISWWVNFAVNFSVLLAALVMTANDTGMTTTILFGVSGIMIILNVIIIPLKTGRTIGHFVSRTKYITASGDKANVFHSILANTVGFFALMGFIMVGIMASTVTSKDAVGITMIVLGIIFMVLWLVNRNFKKNSDMDQGLYDLIFSAYLVKHIPTEDEVAATGIWGRLENAGEWGDKLISKREANAKKAEKKAVAKAKKAKVAKKESEAESKDE